MTDISFHALRADLEACRRTELSMLKNLVQAYEKSSNKSWHCSILEMLCGKKYYRRSTNVSYEQAIKDNRNTLIEVADTDSGAMPPHLQKYAQSAKNTNIKLGTLQKSFTCDERRIRRLIDDNGVRLQSLTTKVDTMNTEFQSEKETSQSMKSEMKSMKTASSTMLADIRTAKTDIQAMKSFGEFVTKTLTTHNNQIAMVWSHIRSGFHKSSVDAEKRNQKMLDILRDIRVKHHSLLRTHNKSTADFKKAMRESELRTTKQLSSIQTQMKEMQQVIANLQSRKDLGDAKQSDISTGGEEAATAAGSVDPGSLMNGKSIRVGTALHTSDRRDSTHPSSPVPRLRRPEDRKTRQQRVGINGSRKRKSASPPGSCEMIRPSKTMRTSDKCTLGNRWLAFLNDKAVKNVCDQVAMAVRQHLGIKAGEPLSSPGIIPQIAAEFYKKLTDDEKSAYAEHAESDQKPSIVANLWDNTSESRKKELVMAVSNRVKLGGKSEAINIPDAVSKEVDEIMKILQDKSLSKEERSDDLSGYSSTDVEEAKQRVSRK